MYYQVDYASAATSESSGCDASDSATTVNGLQCEQSGRSLIKRRKINATGINKCDRLKKAWDNLKADNSDGQNIPNDDNDLFGKHVGETLKSFKSDHARALCKLKIQELLYNFQFGAYSTSTDQPRPYCAALIEF